MNAHFDKKNPTKLGKFPSDSNARNITHYYQLSDAVLGHAIRKLPDINEKAQSYIFTSGPGSLQIHMEIGMLFSYCQERPLD